MEVGEGNNDTIFLQYNFCYDKIMPSVTHV